MMFKSDARAIRDPWLAAVLLTRLPLPRVPRSAFAHASGAVWAYPLVGMVLGGIGAGGAWLLSGFGLGPGALAGIVLIVTALLSGAMHEDGLADCADGFWGATDRARRFEIMRDSHIGTYGVLALILVTLLRWQALGVLLGEAYWLAPVAAAALSRAMMPVVMAWLPQARRDGLGRSVGTVIPGPAVASVLLGTLIAALCLGTAALGALIVALILTGVVALTARRKIGGQTGDVLGATQQISEAAILTICVVLLT